MKIFILIFLCWPKFIIYDPIIGKTTREWVSNDSIPPRFSKRTKQLIRKQWWVKFWTIILSIIPLGPISMITTMLLLRGQFSKGTLIKDELKKQSDRIETIKEELREGKRRFLSSLEKSVNKDKKFDWRQIILPGSPEELKIRELMLKLEALGMFNVPPKDPKYRKKYEEYLKNKDKEDTEIDIPLLDNELAYEAYGITPNPEGDAPDLELDYMESQEDFENVDLNLEGSPDIPKEEIDYSEYEVDPEGDWENEPDDENDEYYKKFL